MTIRSLTALPVFNEVSHVDRVLDEVRRYCDDVLVVDDGSTDGTAERLAARSDIQVVSHEKNQGYGMALRTAFEYAAKEQYDVVVTIDCDGQHEPKRIPRLVKSCLDSGADIVSGSRYLETFSGDSPPPVDRRDVNLQVTAEINNRLGTKLTDAFCGFKAYRVASISKLALTEPGYAMPLQLWVQAVRAGLEIREEPVPLIYLDEKRSFGGTLDDPAARLAYYRRVLDREMASAALGSGERCVDSLSAGASDECRR